MGTMNRPANLPMMSHRKRGFRLGVYVFKDAEIVDFTAPHGVFSVARRFDPELDVFLIADAMRPNTVAVLVAARDLGLPTSRLMRATPHEMLSFVGRGRSMRDYQRLKAALDRLQSTTVATTLRQGLAQRMHRFSWVNEWKEIVRADGQPAGVELVLPDWFYHGVLTESLVLSIDPRYFRLTGGIERWLYRVVRKHGGRQRAGWRFDLPYLYAKSGSQARFTDFAGDVRRVAQRQALPGYRLQVARVGEMEWLIFQRERIAFAE